MPKPRGREHTTLTETAAAVVKVLQKIPGIKMVAPGIIDQNSKRSGHRHITIVHTKAGFELIISGQGVQKVAVHTDSPNNQKPILSALKNNAALKLFTWKERERNPGI
jgi:hypothetical protein